MFADYIKKILLFFQNLIKQNFEILIIYKPSLGTYEVPHKPNVEMARINGFFSEKSFSAFKIPKTLKIYQLITHY